MVRYAQFLTAIWRHQGIRALPRELREMFRYLVTSPHGNTAGLYSLSLLYLADDMQITQEEAQQTLDELCATGRVLYDATAQVVMIRDYLQHHSPSSATQITGVLANVRSVPSNRLLPQWVAWAVHHVPKHAESWRSVIHGSSVERTEDAPTEELNADPPTQAKYVDPSIRATPDYRRFETECLNCDLKSWLVFSAFDELVRAVIGTSGRDWRILIPLTKEAVLSAKGQPPTVRWAKAVIRDLPKTVMTEADAAAHFEGKWARASPSGQLSQGEHEDVRERLRRDRVEQVVTYGTT